MIVLYFLDLFGFIWFSVARVLEFREDAEQYIPSPYLEKFCCKRRSILNNDEEINDINDINEPNVVMDEIQLNDHVHNDE